MPSEAPPVHSLDAIPIGGWGRREAATLEFRAATSKWSFGMFTGGNVVLSARYFLGVMQADIDRDARDAFASVAKLFIDCAREVGKSFG
jgi:hypothetical protein